MICAYNKVPEWNATDQILIPGKKITVAFSARRSERWQKQGFTESSMRKEMGHNRLFAFLYMWGWARTTQYTLQTWII